MAMSDYALAVLGPPLIDAFEARAPSAELRFRHLGRTTRDDEEVPPRAVDGLVMPYGGPSRNLPHHELFRDEWVCVTAEDNDLIGPEPSTEELRALRWVIGYHNPQNGPPVIAALEAQGVHQNRYVTVDSFHLLPRLVAGSRRLALVQGRLARDLGPGTGLRVFRCPFELAPLIEAFRWHPAHTDDPAHTWLRALFRDTVRTRVAAPAPEDA
ncbi:LysR substrate-binding domain-containing protein [Streptomyces sp. DSM 44917]|uniref:LysR substrate-binding domain-containing protein n=1 Tax=Streptomyces boetiae TaxID=3075541 RepID=A0ABU2L7K1_9ACTN|nr:LysR substrate-binding domain-containing protein [Streptomyces sp. DSM 44917]MDT0307554.1 LysR substrate-binding domain-containing protein [Streptomyces sp. DSM 44917]